MRKFYTSFARSIIKFLAFLFFASFLSVGLGQAGDIEVYNVKKPKDFSDGQCLPSGNERNCAELCVETALSYGELSDWKRFRGAYRPLSKFVRSSHLLRQCDNSSSQVKEFMAESENEDGDINIALENSSICSQEISAVIRNPSLVSSSSGCKPFIEYYQFKINETKFCPETESSFVLGLKSNDIEIVRDYLENVKLCRGQKYVLSQKIFNIREGKPQIGVQFALNVEKDNYLLTPQTIFSLQDNITSIPQTENPLVGHCISVAKNWEKETEAGAIEDFNAFESESNKCLLVVDQSASIKFLVDGVKKCRRLIDKFQPGQKISQQLRSEFSSLCPALLTKKVPSAQTETSEKSVRNPIDNCTQDERKLQTVLGTGALRDLSGLLARTKCEVIKNRSAALQRDLCIRQSADYAQRLFFKSDTREILLREFDCPILVAKIDAYLGQRETNLQAETECLRTRKLLADASNSHLALLRLRESNKCQKLDALIGSAITSYCIRESHNIPTAGSEPMDRLQELELTIQCRENQRTIAKQIAETRVKIACVNTRRKLNKISTTDLNGLLTLQRENKCVALRTAIALRIGGLQATLSEDRRCSDRNVTLDNIPLAKIERLKEFLAATQGCSRVILRAEQKLIRARKQLACSKEYQYARDLSIAQQFTALKSMLNQTACADVKSLVNETLAIENRKLLRARADAEKERLENEQQERLALLKIKHDKEAQERTDRLARENADSKLGKPGSVAQPHETQTSALEAADRQNSPDQQEELKLAKLEPHDEKIEPVEIDPKLSQEEINKLVQTELKRLRCYQGSIDGDFGLNSQAAIGHFNKKFLKRGDRLTKSSSPPESFVVHLKKYNAIGRCIPLPKAPSKQQKRNNQPKPKQKNNQAKQQQTLVKKKQPRVQQRKPLRQPDIQINNIGL